jgi:hypothetical protein
MTEEWKEALLASIEAWKRRAATDRAISYFELGCPLCRLGKKLLREGKTTSMCELCPVAKAGHFGCWDTPYEDYEKAQDNFSYHAQREVDFLKSLLPKE